MPSHVLCNGLGLTYKSTMGLSIATIPDVCKTPSPGGPVPIPYPNIANQGSLDKGTKKVKAKGKMVAIKGSQYTRSNGDEAGTAGGVKSSVNMKATDWILYSFDVKMEGKNACRHTDKKFHNNQNTVDLAGNIDPALSAAMGDDVAERLCEAICNCTGVERKQDCVAEQFIKEGNLWPVHTPTDSELLPEVTTKIDTRMTPLLSETGRTTPAGAAAPMSIPKAMSQGSQLGGGTTTRWDFIQVKDPAKPCTTGNVKNYIEIKFPPDDLTENQKAARKRMNKTQRAKVREVTPADCGC